MEEPKYPHRDWVEAGKCGRQPLKDLETWVKGGTFHRYGVTVYDRGPTIDEAIKRIREHPSLLEFDSRWDGSHVAFGVRAMQAGDPESFVASMFHFTPEDASYAALALIEEHERELYELSVPVGFRVSHHDYNASKALAALDPPFYALVMAAMRGADTRNAEKLRRAFPETWDELQARYNAPGGLLPGEKGAGEASAYDLMLADDSPVLGFCPHGVNLDRDFCEHGCRV
jgi:hypothetical protein